MASIKKFETEYFDNKSQSVLAYIENCTKTRKFFDKLIIFGDFDIDEQFTKDMIKYKRLVHPSVSSYIFNGLKGRSSISYDPLNQTYTIKGYSDQMLRFISENGNGALIHYVDNIDLTKGIRDLHE